MKTLKQKLAEMPDNLSVTKVHIETVNMHGEYHTIEFEKSKNKLIITKNEKNEENNQKSEDNQGTHPGN